MKRMSFAATIAPMRNQTKTVTRRNVGSWKTLKPGDRLLAIEKGMGLAKGETQVVIGEIEVVDVRLEPVGCIYGEDPTSEGFDSWLEFIEAWRRMHGRWEPEDIVRRIEFRHQARSTTTKET